MLNDQKYMERALALAACGNGWTSPNPQVGAVIISNGRIIGEGYHAASGRPHAEIEALKQAGNRAIGATLYVTLEPCNHHGKTPPCTDAIIHAGIRRVLCATEDPNDKVRGSGILQLRRAGVEVDVGILGSSAQQLNEQFFTFHEKKRPFVAIKYASSLNGKISGKRSIKTLITNDEARTHARLVRGEYQAIVVGINTILSDDPHLGARNKGVRDPLRIILDSRLRIPLTAQVLRDTNVLIATTRQAPRKPRQALADRGVNMIVYDTEQIPIKKFLGELARREIISVFVEGGAKILRSFVEAGVVDKVYAYYAPILLGGKDVVPILMDAQSASLPQHLRLTKIHIQTFTDNFLISGAV